VFQVLVRLFAPPPYLVDRLHPIRSKGVSENNDDQFETYHVPPHKKLNLSEWPTVAPALSKSKKHYQKLLEEHVKDLSELQQLHYASNRHALLIIFQGMDGAGKDVP